VIDEDEKGGTCRRDALQLHAGPPMKVQFKDIDASAAAAAATGQEVVFGGGRKSHQYGAHDHKAGDVAWPAVSTPAGCRSWPRLLPVLAR